VGGQTRSDQIALIVYVRDKLPREQLEKEEQAVVVPREFEGMGTDVVAPFEPDAEVEALGFTDSHQNSDDMSYVDWARLHEQGVAGQGGVELPFHGVVRDYGDVGVIQDDGTLVQTINGQPVVDFVRAYKLFRLTHPDIYDFVTFFTDTASGMPPQGGSSWYRFVHNDIQGIGFPNFDQRATFGSAVLQGIMFLNQGRFPIWRYVMLQEQGHRWACFAPYRDGAAGPARTDHLLGGWGHWAGEFDDDRSPMDYDTHNWVATNGQFQRVTLSSDQREYCALDLYLMGALGPDELGDSYLLSNIANVSGNTFTADKKLLRLDNFVWANGARAPGAATSPKQFKNGFVLLTKDFDRAHDLADRIDELRRGFEADFRAATQRLLTVDTTLGPLRRELTPSEVADLTDGGYTALHRHQVAPGDLALAGTQFTGTLQPGETQRWFTFNWSPAWVIKWSVRPTTAGGGELVGGDRARRQRHPHLLTIRNTGSAATGFEARYARLR